MKGGCRANGGDRTQTMDKAKKLGWMGHVQTDEGFKDTLDKMGVEDGSISLSFESAERMLVSCHKCCIRSFSEFPF
jgi:hypothetical protein